MKSALTIAGFDPSGGAGIQADLRVFSTFNVYGLSVAAALTAQNTRGVKAVRPVDAAFVRRQLEVLLSDMRPDAMKTGMLFSRENVRAVAEMIGKYRLGNIVVDPVLLSSTRRSLSGRGLGKALREELLPLCTVVTPNMHEAAVLAGIEIRTIDDMKKAAVILHGFGAENVIITGGHLERSAVDVFYDGNFTLMKGRRVPGEYHGTGCRFSSAIAALMSKGFRARDAARLAKTFMQESLNKTFATGGGMRLFR